MSEALAPIATARLSLLLLTPPVMEAILAGDSEAAGRALGCHVPVDWPGDDMGLLRLRFEQARRRPDELPWLLRAMVLRDGTNELVGHINFHGAPDDAGIAELGYTVLPAHRRRGYARESVLAMMAWASEEHGVRRFRLSIAPTNVPSLALARSLGFRQTGVQWDEEDGEELVFETMNAEQ